MTTVDVLWVSRHEDVLARGYADQGLLDALLVGTVWRPPGALGFRHHEVIGDEWPDVPGAVVVLNGRTHQRPRDVEWLRRRMARLDWCLFVLCGIEEGEWPVWKFPEDARHKTWVMQPRPEHARLSGLIPGGWYPGTREGVRAGADERTGKTLDWFFGGQITHERRQECAKVLRELRTESIEDPEPWQQGPATIYPPSHFGNNALLIETDGYLRGIPQAEYWQHLAHAKVAPCPSGPYTVDTARPLEALEAGCVPVVDMLSPLGPEFDYWALLDPDCPLRRIWDWADFPAILAEELDAWPHNANRVTSWWCAWKLRTAHRLHDQVRAVAGLPLERATPDDQITVLITTSPAPLHPSTEHLGFVVASVREQLPTAEIVVVCDGVRPEQADRAEDYAEYVRRLVWRCQHEWSNILPVVIDSWGHQANAIRRGLEYVTTPLVLLVEHDTPMVGEINWAGCCELVGSGEANVIRFHHEASVLPSHRNLMLDRLPHRLRDVPLLRTAAFWMRPHLARADWYREILAAYFPPEARTFVEDRLYGEVWCDYLDHGEPGWWNWRIFQYAPPGETMLRSWHLDSRADDPKWPVSFK